jgi:hypothetical protein
VRAQRAVYFCGRTVSINFLYSTIYWGAPRTSLDPCGHRLGFYLRSHYFSHTSKPATLICCVQKRMAICRNGPEESIHSSALFCLAGVRGGSVGNW